MQSLRKSTVTVACLGALVLGGGVLSAVALGATGHGKHKGQASLKANTGTTSTSTGTFTSNEEVTHEAGESATVEAAEANGTRPGGDGPHGGGPFKPNEDATHETGESAAREAQEDAGQRPSVP